MNYKLISKILIILILISFLINLNTSTSYASTETTIGKLPIGSIVYDPSWEWEHKTGDNYSGSGIKKPVKWIITAKNHTGYPENSVTLLSQDMIGKYIYYYTSSYYRDSDVRSFVNGTFYNHFSNNFKNSILTTNITNIAYGGSKYITTDKIFIPSETELGGTGTFSILETYTIGNVWDYFRSQSQEKRMITDNMSGSYWTRSPISKWTSGTPPVPLSLLVTVIYKKDGHISGNGVDNTYVGIRPALNITNNILVKPIGNNEYEIMWEKPNKNPDLTILQPINNHRIGDQDTIIISGNIKDEDIGNQISIKYSLDSTMDSNITLTQPISLISNGQVQSFKGHIILKELKTGSNILKLWAEDNKGGKSAIVEIPIVLFNTLESILNSLRTYAYKAGEPQLLVINSNTRIVQNEENDRLINLIKIELNSKNVKLFFIGQDKETEQYIKSKLLLD